MSKCPTCGKAVYFAEKFTALGKDYHKLCFKCVACGKQLELGKFSERDKQLYCKMCYNSKYQDKGYGYGGAGGTLSSYQPGGPAQASIDMRSQGEANKPSNVGRPSGGSPSSRSAPAPSSGGGGSAPNFCPQCGNKSSGAKFCANCGAKLC